jgi:hypothetical protein
MSVQSARAKDTPGGNPLALSRDEQLLIAAQLNGSFTDQPFSWLLDVVPGSRTAPGGADYDAACRTGNTTAIVVGEDDPIHVVRKGNRATAWQDGYVLGSAVRHGASLVVDDQNGQELFEMTRRGKDLVSSNPINDDRSTVHDSGTTSTLSDWNTGQVDEIRWTAHGATIDHGDAGSVSARGRDITVSNGFDMPSRLELSSSVETRSGIGQETARMVAYVNTDPMSLNGGWYGQ